MVRRR
ncbi:hypothetical protein D047_3113A, partial [Vibrio parahaemolyticus VPTS-2010_2]